jgi:hypothetical protein
MKWYHFFPGLFFAGQVFGGLSVGLSFCYSAFAIPGFIWGLANVLYFGLAVYFSLSHPKAKGFLRLFLPFGFLLFHLSYGLGNILGLGYKRKIPNF